jgi:hypothetical protein
VSGAHRIQKPHGRLVLAVRLPGRYALAAFANLRMHMAAARDWFSRHIDDVLDWLDERFTRRTEDFWAEPPASETSPDPIPAEASVVEHATALARPSHLTPNDAAAALHAEHPHLPWQVLEWRIGDDVHGQVRSLDCAPNQMREVVELYAAALGAGLREDQADEGRTVLTATGEFAGVLFIVSAVFISADTVPLLVYEETAEDESLDDTLTTQVISPRVLAEVLGT